MPDLDLNDDELKLVHYRILFVKRDCEVAFPHSDSLVHDNINSGAFAAWKVAEFIERLKTLPVPEKWGGGHNPKHRPHYPHSVWYCKNTCRWMVGKLDDDDYKYLRVSYEVTDRYPRQSLEYQEDHLKVLRQIRDRLPSVFGDHEHSHHCDSHHEQESHQHGSTCHTHETSCHTHEASCEPECATMKVHG